ncbi:MAG: nuclear transport factor 2 family protein [bacterium]
MNRWFTVGLLLFGIFGLGCSKYVDPLTEIAAVKVALDRFYIAQQKEDMTALSALFAHEGDLVVFGPDEGERYVGWEAVKGMYQRQMDATEGLQTTLTDQVIKVSKDGAVSWVSSLNHATGQIGDEAVETDYRATVVLEKREGKWLIVHIHTSKPVAKQGGSP